MSEPPAEEYLAVLHNLNRNLPAVLFDGGRLAADDAAAERFDYFRHALNFRLLLRPAIAGDQWQHQNPKVATFSVAGQFQEQREGVCMFSPFIALRGRQITDMVAARMIFFSK